MSMFELNRDIEGSCRRGAVLTVKYPKDPHDCWLYKIGGACNWRQPKIGMEGYKIVNVEISYNITTVSVHFHKTQGWIPIKRQTLSLRKRNHMKSKIQNEVETTGEVGKIYTTETGMNEADPYKHLCGWKQISPTTRIQVESFNLAVHDSFYSWRLVQEK